MYGAPDPLTLDGLTVEEDLAEFRSLDERLMNIAQTQNTTASGLLHASHCETTWTRFKKRKSQRIQDILCLEEYLEIFKTGGEYQHMWSKLSTRAAHSRIRKDQDDLIAILAAVDSTRNIERLEQKAAATRQAFAQMLNQMDQRKQEYDELLEESQLWGVTDFEDDMISSRFSIDIRRLRAKALELLDEKQSTLRELRKQKRRRR